MDKRKPVLELKDLPPPPHHTAASQPFPLTPLPLPPPCLPPLPQDSLQQLPLQGGSPKVSVCTHCEHCSTDPLGRGGYGVVSGGGSASISSGVGVSSGVPLYLPPCSQEASFSRLGASQITPTTLNSHPHFPSLGGGGGDARATLLPSGSYKLHIPSVDTTSQPLSFQSHSHLPCSCCTGGLLRPLHSYPSIPLPYNESKFITTATPHHWAAGYYPCGGDYNPATLGVQRSLAAHSDPHIPTSGHICSSNAMHFNLERTVCRTGAHYCRDCLTKPADKLWPNIPLPLAQSVSVPIPVCNGCGTSSDGLLLLGSSLGKSATKYGSPEGPENIPPVGVFWDIENCCVPSGRSAAAVVQRLRSHFFQGHREAEFICVCDISKENKAVIQELNNCQVTVAHINATAKNAADDKLRQSLRRFAETHTAPATVVLVSSDVNFASELSDLRHRHGFQVILVHKSGQTSDALLQHAHRHVAFEEMVADLPPRQAVKSQVGFRDQLFLNEVACAQTTGAEVMPKSLTCSCCFQRAEYAIIFKLRVNVPSPIRRDLSSPRSASDSERHVDRSSGEFQISTPSAFSKLTLSSPCLPVGPQASEPFSDGADLQVANLDYRMSRKELQQSLHDAFSRHGRVKGVELSPHTDYQLKATVQFVSLQQAISAVSSLHRYKIGSKRIHVSLITGAGNKSLAMLRSEIFQILQDAPASCLPLFKFTEIYEKKFGRKLVVSDLYRLQEVVAVREQGGGRLVCLLPSSQARQSPLGSSQSLEGSSANGSPVVFEQLEYHEPVCSYHYTQQNFSEADFDPDSYKIPFVVVSLKTLASQVHCLLQSHEGTLPLLSFSECYASELGPLAVSEEGEEEGSVPLEHLITCIPGINIVTAQNGFKVIKWIHNKPPASNTDQWTQRCKSPVGNPQLIQFSRELIDLMKGQPCNLMPISKFIPAYHHHYAKQCRVSDYGYSKLLELLEAVPHVLQILGMGTKRLLTLTHRAQVKRFTQDLLKLLKFQASKQVAITDFMQAYHWCFSRDWRVLDYGMCDLMDLLAEIPDTTITITHQDLDTVISVPKRDRTSDEMERTKQFGKEVVDLLRHQAHCRMAFSKFIPTYHHHFGRQCKLAYYGFTKLMELFEAIPDVLVVLECGEEKVLTLTEVERVKALAAQLVKMLRSQRDSSLPAAQLLSEYSKTFGYGLRLQDYDVSSLPALLVNLCHVVKVVDGTNGREVQLINRKSLRSLTCQLLSLLMGLGQHEGDGSVSVEGLSLLYHSVHGVQLNPCEYGFLSLSELLKSLPYLVEVGERGEERVRLTRLYQFARRVRALLHTYHYHQISLTEFPGAYAKFTGRGLQPRSYGYGSVDDLLNAIPQVVWIKGHGHKRIIVLKNDMKVSFFFSPSGVGGVETELLCLTSPVDLLCGPVPSCLPSPQLHPDPVLQQADLIRFEQTPSPAERDKLEEEAVAEEVAAPAVCDTSEPIEALTDNNQNIVVSVSMTTKPPQNVTRKMASVENSPSKRAPRNKVKLAANFSFTAAP
uniref:Meiosis regulator and mRNA stability factor 1 n=1 Tax=Oncorhynchus mykiss TaxID=8022 RepID=A0A8C7NMJ8_ONCMY